MTDAQPESLAAAIDRPIVGQSGVTYLGDGVYEIN